MTRVQEKVSDIKLSKQQNINCIRMLISSSLKYILGGRNRFGIMDAS